MRNRARLLILLTAASSGAALALTVAGARHVSVVTVALVIAVAWAFAVSLFDAAVFWCARTARAFPPNASERAGVTYIMRLGEERRDIARTSILLAAQAGPVRVVSTSHHDVLDELGDIGVIEHIAPTIQDAVHDAAMATTTDAVLLLSASAFPVAESCELAAAQLTDDVGWVIATAPAFNHDRYAPREREQLNARVRSAARRLGLVTWEPDATIVRTSLIREHRLDTTKPYGGWLRARVADGFCGLTYTAPVAVQAAPADAPVFWPARTRRQRGLVADLADATTVGSVRTRALACAALMRELVAYPMLLWLAAIVLIGRSGKFPLRIAPVPFFSMLLVISGARWATSRVAYGVGVHPVEEARATAYDLPGSLLALPSALTRRVRRTRIALPDQPLLWAAVALTLASTAPLVNRQAETNSAIGVSVGLTLAALAMSWVFAMRAFGARGWDRASYRLDLDRPATVDGHPARTVDASPSGLALVGVPDTIAPGDAVALAIQFDDAESIALHGTVAERRVSGGLNSIGVALDLDADARDRWVRRLFSATGLTGRVPTLPDGRGPRRRMAFEPRPPGARRALASFLPAVAVTAVSALVVSALLLAFLGYRPMVDRSGSMVPTIRVGDVVITEWVHADRIRPGQIVTFPQDIGRTELITHRVQHVRVVGHTVKVETKGDANISSEHWSASTNTLVGRVVWRVPWVGTLISLLGSALMRRLLLVLGVAVVMFATAIALTRRRKVVVTPA